MDFRHDIRLRNAVDHFLTSKAVEAEVLFTKGRIGLTRTALHYNEIIQSSINVLLWVLLNAK